MDYNFSWPTVHVEPRLMLARNIALVDVLRELNDTVKDDAVILYLVSCDCSGLKSCVLSDLYKAAGGYGCSEVSPSTTPKASPLFIPDGLRKMAYDFAISALAQEVSGLIWCDGCDLWDSSKITALPKKVRDVLDTSRITNCAELLDHRPIIDSLRAVVVNEAITLDKDKHHTTCCTRQSEQDLWKKYGFDAVTSRQTNTISMLCRMAHKAVEDLRLNRKLPGKFEWDALCNLLDILLILNYTGGYSTASHMFTIHEYAKMAEVGRERCGSLYEGFWEISRQKQFDRSRVDKAVDLYSRLSPLAALMVGRHGRMSMIGLDQDDPDPIPFWYYDQLMFKKYLSSLFPATSTAVKLFMKYEIAIERCKLRDLRMAFREHLRKNGEPTGNGRCCEDCCDESPCCCG